MLIAWTTVASRADAEKLAGDVIAENLAACVQVEGPISSHYRWEGRQERTEEYRLCFKCLPETAAPLETFVLKHHPYATPEWLLVRAERVGEKYLYWARATASKLPL